jgi:hypothetical protein
MEAKAINPKRENRTALASHCVHCLSKARTMQGHLAKRQCSHLIFSTGAVGTSLREAKMKQMV